MISKILLLDCYTKNEKDYKRKLLLDGEVMMPEPNIAARQEPAQHGHGRQPVTSRPAQQPASVRLALPGFPVFHHWWMSSAASAAASADWLGGERTGAGQPAWRR